MFDAFCQATPEKNTFTDGTQVLLDNQSPDTRVIAIDDTPFTLPGYGWQVVTLTSTQWPDVFAIDCGAAKNVGKIVLEAPSPLASASEETPSPTP